MPSETQLEDELRNATPGEPVDIWIYSAHPRVQPRTIFPLTSPESVVKCTRDHPTQTNQTRTHFSLPKDTWVARQPAVRIGDSHLGAAIRIGGELFEVLTVEEATAPGYAIRYGLRKWDPQHVAQSVIPYTAETRAPSGARDLEQEHRRKLRASILWLWPLAGLAPDSVQREWGKSTGLNMKWIAAASAALTTLVCMGLILAMPRFSSPAKLFSWVFYFFGIEAALRTFWILLSGNPHGTIALIVPHRIGDAIARAEHRRQQSKHQAKATFEQDEVVRQPAARRLLIRSMLLDDMLVGPQPVLFEGAVYKPVKWQEEGKRPGRRFVYELEKIDADPRDKPREYALPRASDRQKLVELFTRNRDSVQRYCLIWGTYPRGDQLRLESQYRFAAAKSTAITAAFFLAATLLEFLATVFFRSPSRGEILGSLYWVLESLYRLYRSKIRGAPAASIAGYLLKVFLKPPSEVTS